MAQRKHGGFELDEDLAHQRLEWRLQRVGWALMALLVAAALSGLLGYGPLSRSRGGDEALTVRYDRIQRSGALSRYELDVGAQRGTEWVLAVDRRLLDGIEIESIEPEPESATAGAGRSLYRFAAEPGLPQRVVMHYRPSTFGRLHGTLALPGAAPVRVDQFVLP